MIYGDAFRPAPRFLNNSNWTAGPGGFGGPMGSPNAPLNMERAGRDLYAKPEGPNKAAGYAAIGANLMQSMADARRKAVEAHEEGLRRISELGQMRPPSAPRPQQQPLMQFGNFGGAPSPYPRLGRSGFFGSRGGY